MTHGYANKIPEYQAWKAMKDRCFNTKSVHYHTWGGRGITVCNEWRKDFPAFLRDVGFKSSPKLTLERINNNGNYEKGNVVWASRAVQARNRRPVVINQEIADMIRLLRRSGVKPTLISRTLGLKMPLISRVCKGRSWRPINV